MILLSKSIFIHFIHSFDHSEHPLVAQLGGNNPDYLARAAEILQKKGYDEINLNCGCPSNVVSVRLSLSSSSIGTLFWCCSDVRTRESQRVCFGDEAKSHNSCNNKMQNWCRW